MKNRTTPENIAALRPYECFVFGSNLAGRHGAGAAKKAMGWGAIYGHGWGPQGNTYAIPSLNWSLNKLPLSDIGFRVDEFIAHARRSKEWTFLITEIGCGLASFTPKEIAPLFVEAIGVPNIHLPARFWKILQP